MLKVGLTGGIASGKSLVSREFVQLGVPCVDADAINRELTAPGQPGLKALTAVLGEAILAPDGTLDRTRLRTHLFQDAALRRKVEDLLHPLVLAELRDRLSRAAGPYVIAVIPLLVEVPAARALVDRLLLVDCAEKLQLARVMSRDGMTQQAAQAVLAAQTGRRERQAAADDILLNEGPPSALKDAVVRLHNFYIELAASGDYRRAGLALP